MKNITEEQIDSIIDKVSRVQNESMFMDFVNNYNDFKRVFDKYVKDNVPDAPSGYAKRFANEIADAFAAFKLAQDNCIQILKCSLKEFLCEDSSSDSLNGIE